MGNDIPDSFIDLFNIWQQHIDFHKESEELLLQLDKANRENDIQKYIKDNKKWFIPAALFENYDFGHHEAYIVPEQQLGERYRADYMLLGRNSIGYNLVLVEFEDVNVEYHIKKLNKESKEVEAGLVQVRDWMRWMDDNRRYFLHSVGLEKIAGNIPSWGIWYCLVVSRRKYMDSVANELRAQMKRNTPGLNIVSYDRLVDNTQRLVNGF